MDHMASSWKKSQNFTEREKEILVECISRRKEIIEHKKNNAQMIYKKEQAWEEIEVEFNANFGITQRTLKQLKGGWKNLKSRAKARVAEVCQEAKASGCGEPSTADIDGVTKKVLSIVSEKNSSMDDQSIYDSFAIHTEKESSDGFSKAIHTDEDVKPPDLSTNKMSEYSTSKISEYSTSKALEFSTNNLSNCSKNKISDFSTNKVSDYIIQKAPEFSTNQVPEYSKKNVSRYLVNKVYSKSNNGVETIDLTEMEQLEKEELKNRILEMAVEEHKRKMKILDLKRDILIIKKRKLEHELAACKCIHSEYML